MNDDLNSVGLVETRILDISLPEDGLRLERGGVLPALQVAFEAYGELNDDKSNVILICHALTGDAHVAGRHRPDDPKPGWWEEMVGPGRGIDTNRYHVICSNILGGCSGTTGPVSINPATGKVYGADFPDITISDMVKVQHLLLQELGINHLAVVLGGSLGGMQVLEWSIQFPDFVDKCICIASAASLSAQALAFDVVGREAITSDPDFHNGAYSEAGVAPETGLAQARRIGHITYLSPEMMTIKFGREKKEIAQTSGSRFATFFEVESYLRYQGKKFVERFDANSYLHITHAMDSYDLAEKFGSLEEALKRVQARTLIVALSADWLFTPEQSLDLARSLVRLEKPVSYCMLEAPHGHDAFLVDIDHLADVVSTFVCGERVHRPDVQSAARHTSLSDAGYNLVEKNIERGASVLDLGCGDGELLMRLSRHEDFRGLGVDIDLEHFISVLALGQNVLQQDVDRGLSLVGDEAFDYVILNDTLQVVKRPRFVMQEILRVAKTGIISFPNFANIHNRVQLMFGGRMPRSRTLPYDWYDTPNIHLPTLKDFIILCEEDNVKILDIFCLAESGLSRFFLNLGFRNLGAERIFVKIARNHG